MLIIENKTFVGLHDTTYSGDQYAPVPITQKNDVIIRNCLIDGTAVTDALKFSKARRILVEDCTIYGGSEDCLDAVRGEDYTFRRCTFHIQGNTAFTIKGGVKKVLIEKCIFIGKPKWAAIDLGNFSNYDIVKRPRVRAVTIRDNDFTQCEGTTVRVLHSEYPILENNTGKIRIFYIPAISELITFSYFFMRSHGLIGSRPVVNREELVIQDWEY